MTTPTVAIEARWRPTGDTVSVWQVRRFSVSQALQLTELERGVAYDIQVRSIGANGRNSAWVDAAVAVASTNRRGAAALPNVANQMAMWDVDTSVTYAASSTAEGVSTATISVSAGTLVIAGVTVAYGASSATIDGAAGDEVTAFLYYDDPLLEGGTLPLGLTTNVVESANANGRVAIAPVSLTFPAAGGSSSGGGGIGGGGGSGGSKNPGINQEAI